MTDTEVATVKGKTYILVRALEGIEDGNSCIGCVFDKLNEENGTGCSSLLAGIVPACKGNLIYIRNTPRAIAKYVAGRLT